MKFAVMKFALGKNSLYVIIVDFYLQKKRERNRPIIARNNFPNIFEIFEIFEVQIEANRILKFKV